MYIVPPSKNIEYLKCNWWHKSAKNFKCFLREIQMQASMECHISVFMGIYRQLRDVRNFTGDSVCLLKRSEQY